VNQSFPDLGPQTTKTASHSYRLVAELDGNWGAWDVHAAGGLSRVETRLSLNNFVSLPNLQTALSSGAYSLAGGGSAATDAFVAPAAASTSYNDLHFLSVRGSRDAMPLPGGPLSIGGGAELTHRALRQEFPDSFANGAQASNIYAFGAGKQNIAAAYAELVAPLTRRLEVDAAGRIDHYDTYGTSATPKLGIKYTPAQELTLRGTYAQGFRAPNPVEIGRSGSSAGFLPPLVDTAACQTAPITSPCTIPVGGTELQLPGHDLKPEKSRSYTLGLILEPSQMLNVSVDYYDIRITDQIVSVGLFGQSQIDHPAQYGTLLYRVNSPTTANAAPTSPSDTILYGTYPFINLGETHTSGFDIDLRMRFMQGEAGRFTPQLQWTHLLRYDITREGVTYQLAGTHGPSFVSTNTGTPRDRAALGLSWERGPVEITGTFNYISAFSVTDASYGSPDCASALAAIFGGGQPPAALCTVGSFTEFNLSGRYALDKHWTFRGSVTNLFNRAAPIDAAASGSTGGGVASGGAHYDPSLHQDAAVGRFVTLGMAYSF
jgi:iron complex outermembrane receptor protein